MRTPIYDAQRERAEELLKKARHALEALCEERLNLDRDTREEINGARASVAESERLLADQPNAEKF